MIITILMDNPKSWYAPYARTLLAALLERGHDAELVHTTDEVRTGDVAFFLSCEKIIKKDIRDRNKHSIVVHSSKLPAGKGWSPLTWQILEGKSEIINTLFEAVDQVDAGVIYLQNTMHFEGHELLPELHRTQGESINALVLDFMDEYPDIVSRGKTQTGEESFYPRRKKEASELDPRKTIAEQFNMLRVVDNEKYPAFFRHQGRAYILKIQKEEKE